MPLLCASSRRLGLSGRHLFEFLHRQDSCCAHRAIIGARESNVLIGNYDDGFANPENAAHTDNDLSGWSCAVDLNNRPNLPSSGQKSGAPFSSVKLFARSSFPSFSCIYHFTRDSIRALRWIGLNGQ